MAQQRTAIKPKPHKQVTKGVVWITGASMGIGQYLAHEMLRQGWKVAASARSADALAEMERGSGGNLRAYPVDITDNEAVKSTIEKICKDFGQIDIAVLNAGTHRPVRAHTLKAADFKALTELNLIGTANCLEHLLPGFIKRQGGQVAVVASVAGYRGLPTSSAYGMTKAGLINMAEALKVELDFHGVKMQVINPGFVRTPLTDKNDFEMPHLVEPQDAAKAMYKGLLSKRFEIAFPAPFVRQLKLMRMIPEGLYFWLTRKLVSARANRESKSK